ncbi:MAG: amino acid ABC transporter permease [Microbacteriaceae bacterium]|nr:amino acid ABC transporter permease [Microbacteriaceae bacterium]
MSKFEGPAPSEIELERRVYRKKQGVRSTLIALVSTLLFAIVVAVGLSLTPGVDRAAEVFFSFEHAINSLPRVWDGFLINMLVLVVAAIAVPLIGIIIALLRSLQGPAFFPLRILATAYADFFRGVPLIIMLYLIGFGIPSLRIFSPYVPFWVYGAIAIIIIYSAYVSEVFRAGIEAVHPSQRMAARSLGFTHWQTMRKIIVPQATRKMIPALMNDFVALQKDVGLISILGGVDAIRAAQIAGSADANYTPYVVAGLLFVLLALPTVRIADWFSARLRKREQAGSIL